MLDLRGVRWMYSRPVDNHQNVRVALSRADGKATGEGHWSLWRVTEALGEGNVG